MQTLLPSYDLLVIGGGAAGFFGALSAAQHNPSLRIIILEKGNQLLAKVLVSGGGRCNVTHAEFDPARLVENYPRGSRALRGPFSRFQPRDTVAWFEARGVKLKTEPDGRMFPVSNRSDTIVRCLLEEAYRLGIEIHTRAPVEGIDRSADDLRFQVTLRSGELLYGQSVLLAVGGDRQSFRLAQGLGHRIHPPVPSLFTFNIPDSRLSGLAGISVEMAQLRLPAVGLESRGPLLITHWGLSGPAVLKLSAWGARLLHEAGYQMELWVNWLPELHLDELYARLQAAKSAGPRQQLAARDPLGRLPQRLWKSLAAAAGVPEALAWAEASNSLLRQLAVELGRGVYAIRGKGVFKDEFVTCGGVDLDEVNFKTMESRLIPGLYLAGEVLDIDGLTGGFNFQSAWTTGYLAGQAFAARG